MIKQIRAVTILPEWLTRKEFERNSESGIMSEITHELVNKIMDEIIKNKLYMLYTEQDIFSCETRFVMNIDVFEPKER